MYGPLPEAVLAVLFRLSEPSLYTARLLSFAAMLGVLALALGIAGPRIGWAGAAVGFALWLGADRHAAGYFIYGKPDAFATLLAFTGVFLHVRAVTLNSGLRCLAAAALFVAAFFSKQNMAAFAMAAPMGYAANCVLRNGQISLRGCLLALAPALAVALTVLLLHEAFPMVFGYLILIAAGCPIRWVNCVHYFGVVTSSGLFLLALVAFGALLLQTRLRPSSNDVQLAAAWLCGLAISIVSAAKQGGGFNSLQGGMLLCAFVPLYCAARLDFKTWIPPLLRKPWAAAGLGLVFAALLLRVTVPTQDYGIPRFEDKSHAYLEAVQYLRTLDTLDIVSPEDPVLLLLAGKVPGLNMYLEADRTIVSKPNVINHVLEELYIASDISAVSQTLQKLYSFVDYEAMLAQRKHVVEVKYGFFGADYNLLNTDVLVALGFRKHWENVGYAVWERDDR